MKMTCTLVPLPKWSWLLAMCLIQRQEHLSSPSIVSSLSPVILLGRLFGKLLPGAAPLSVLHDAVHHYAAKQGCADKPEGNGYLRPVFGRRLCQGIAR